MKVCVIISVAVGIVYVPVIGSVFDGSETETDIVSVNVGNVAV